MFSLSSCHKDSVDVDGVLSSYYVESQHLSETSKDSTLHFTFKFMRFVRNNNQANDNALFNPIVENITSAFYSFGYDFEYIDDHTYAFSLITLVPEDWGGTDYFD